MYAVSTGLRTAMMSMKTGALPRAMKMKAQVAKKSRRKPGD